MQSPLPPRLYAALFTVDNDSEPREISGANYTRILIELYGSPVRFPPVQDDWGQITHYGFFDAPEEGSLIFIELLGRAVDPGDFITVPALTLD